VNATHQPALIQARVLQTGLCRAASEVDEIATDLDLPMRLVPPIKKTA